MASKMRSKRPSRRSRTGRRPRSKAGDDGRGPSERRGTQRAPPADLRETMGIVPSGIAEWPLMHEESMSVLCQPKASRPSPDGMQDTGNHGRGEDDRADAGRFKGKNPPWIECHAGIVDGCRATALIWIMGFKARCRERALGG
jgi:hypothetical protein